MMLSFHIVFSLVTRLLALSRASARLPTQIVSCTAIFIGARLQLDTIFANATGH